MVKYYVLIDDKFKLHNIYMRYTINSKYSMLLSMAIKCCHHTALRIVELGTSTWRLLVTIISLISLCWVPTTDAMTPLCWMIV